jgi:hypothetical protein
VAVSAVSAKDLRRGLEHLHHEVDRELDRSGSFDTQAPPPASPVLKPLGHPSPTALERSGGKRLPDEVVRVDDGVPGNRPPKGVRARRLGSAPQLSRSAAPVTHDATSGSITV